jgi:hypothetical protein
MHLRLIHAAVVPYATSDGLGERLVVQAQDVFAAAGQLPGNPRQKG